MRAAHPDGPRGSQPRQNGLTSRCSARGFRRGRPPRGEGGAASDSGFAPSLFRAAPPKRRGPHGRSVAAARVARSPVRKALGKKRLVRPPPRSLRCLGRAVPAPIARQRPANRRSPLTSDPRDISQFLIRAFFEAAGKNGPAATPLRQQKTLPPLHCGKEQTPLRGIPFPSRRKDAAPHDAPSSAPKCGALLHFVAPLRVTARHAPRPGCSA